MTTPREAHETLQQVTGSRPDPFRLDSDEAHTVSTRETYTGHDAGEVCECVADHNPNPMELNRHHIWPLGMGGQDTPDNLVWLCPTSHANVHELLRAWVRYEGEPPWSIRKRFSPYIRELAETGWARWMAGTVGGNLPPNT